MPKRAAGTGISRTTAVRVASPTTSDPDPSPPFISQRVEEGDYYLFDLKPATDADLTVVCGGRERCGEGYVVDRSTFPFLSIEFVAAGAGDVRLQGTVQPLRAGSLFVYAPGVAHRITAESQAPMTKYFVDFVGTRARTLFAALPLGRVLEVDDPLRIQSLFEELQRAGHSQRPSARRICALLVEVLLLHAAEFTGPPEATDSRSWATYLRCRRHIETHAETLHSLAEVAGICAISEAYLCRIFRRYHRLSPYRFLINCRMSHAASLLVLPALLVKDVAIRLGFENPYHFSKVFKRVHGLPPEEFRRQRWRN